MQRLVNLIHCLTIIYFFNSYICDIEKPITHQMRDLIYKLCPTEKNFMLKNYDNFPEKNLREMYEKYHTNLIQKYSIGVLFRIKYGKGHALMKRLKMNKKRINREFFIYQDAIISNNFKNEKGFLKILGCAKTNNYVYFIYEDIYNPLTFEMSLNDEFKEKRNYLERLKNYKQLLESILLMHKNNLVMNSFAPKNIMVMDNEYENMSILGFENTIKVDEAVEDHFAITNPPEMNNTEIIYAHPKQDIFSFGMTIGMLEIGLDDFFKILTKKELQKNYKKNIYNGLRSKIINELKKKIGRSKSRASIFMQFFRWLKLFFIEKKPVEYCIDLVCLIKTSISFNIYERPNSKILLAKLNELIENYNPDDIIYPKGSEIEKDTLLL